MNVICLDQKKPVPINTPHGAWWLTVRIPFGRRRHVYIGAATAARFVPGLGHAGRIVIDRERLVVLVLPRKFHGGRHVRDWVMLWRFCAHVYCAEPMGDH